MNALMKTFFDAMTDGVAIVNLAGEVQYINTSGQGHFNAKLGAPFPDPRVVQAIKDLQSGFAKPPVSIALKAQMGTTSGRNAKLMPLPIPEQFAVVINILDEKQFYELTLQNFYEFIRIDLGRPIQQFAQQLDFQTAEDDGDDWKALINNGKALAERLTRLEIMAELFGTSPLVDQERLVFEDIIQDSLNAEAPALEKREIEVYLDGLSDDLPPVYGSRIWLTRALRELINNAGRHAVPKSKLEILLRCTGTHVILSLRNHGQFTNSALSRKRLFVAFNQVEQYVQEKKAPGGSKATPTRGPGLGLAICQQIVHLHGGRINVVEGDENDIIEFNLELATGAPAQDTQLLDVQQAQRYAHDMAALQQRLRATRVPQSKVQ